MQTFKAGDRVRANALGVRNNPNFAPYADGTIGTVVAYDWNLVDVLFDGYAPHYRSYLKGSHACSPTYLELAQPAPQADYRRAIEFLATQIAPFYTEDFEDLDALSPASLDTFRTDSFVRFAAAMFGVHADQIVEDVLTASIGQVAA